VNCNRAGSVEDRGLHRRSPPRPDPDADKTYRPSRRGEVAIGAGGRVRGDRVIPAFSWRQTRPRFMTGETHSSCDGEGRRRASRRAEPASGCARSSSAAPAGRRALEKILVARATRLSPLTHQVARPGTIHLDVRDAAAIARSSPTSSPTSSLPAGLTFVDYCEDHPNEASRQLRGARSGRRAGGRAQARRSSSSRPSTCSTVVPAPMRGRSGRRRCPCTAAASSMVSAR